jgi:LPXTG-site transpeptidase (sortase) family protein
MKSRVGKVIEVIVITLLVVGCLGALGYLAYKVAAPVDSGETAPVEEEPVRIYTHDELLGPPLSFETPAYIRIPAIGVDEEVREGDDNDEIMYTILAQGPIHITHTGYPGQKGNCVISGHRTTCTRPFNRLDELKEGDIIAIDNPRGHYEYTVYAVYAIDPAENVTLTTDEPIITLTTCHPEHYATQRLVARGALASFTPIEFMDTVDTTAPQQ